MEATKKIGRPTESKKDFMLRTRIEPEILKKLEAIAEKEKFLSQKLLEEELKFSMKP